jgi:polysaccharide export outer membrane protein
MLVSLVSLCLALCRGGWAGSIPDKVELRVGESQKLEVSGLTRFTVDDAKIIKVTKLPPNTLQIAAQKDGATYLRVVTEKGTRPILCLVSSSDKTSKSEAGAGEAVAEKKPTSSGEDNGKKAEEKTPKPEDAADADETPLSNEDFLQPGDVIALEVAGEANLNKPYPVDEQGFITMPLLDKVRAAGLTPTQLQRKLTQNLTKYLIDPVVKVTVAQKSERAIGTVTVVGAVEKPGTYPIKRGEQRKVIEWLAQSLTKTSADLSRVQLTRESVNKEPRTLNIKQLYDGGNAADNIIILPGDILYVPELQKVTIMGAVEKPGTLQFTGEVRLFEVVQQAGGAQRSGDLRRVDITHTSGQKITVNMLLAVQEGNPAGNPPIQPGDFIVVPPLKAIRVVGAVQKSGDIYISDEKISVIRLLDQAGGYAPNADLSKVQILHDNGEPPVVIDLGAILKGQKPSVDVQPGDMLLMPIGTGNPTEGGSSDSSKVMVLGEVKKFGTFKLTEPKDLLELLQEVGAIENGGADLENVEVTFKDGTTKIVDIEKLRRNNDQTQNIVLKGGERVYVPKLSPMKTIFYVTGAVGRPGLVKYEKDMTLFQGIVLAGGPAKYSKKDVSIKRMNPETKKMEALAFDLEKIQKGEAEDPKLQPGDVVYVGEGKAPFNWRNVWGTARDAAWIFYLFAR